MFLPVLTILQPGNGNVSQTIILRVIQITDFKKSHFSRVWVNLPTAFRSFLW
jgi:hypothetical protein